MPTIELHDLDDPRLNDFARLTDSALRRRIDSERGLYLAESKFVFERALAAGHEPRSVLAERSALPEVGFLLTAAGFGDAVREQAGLPPVPVFTGDAAVLERLTGFELHHGVIGCMNRPSLLDAADVIAGRTAADAAGGTDRRRLVVIEGVVDPTNVGLIFRSAGALGADGILLTPRTADPLYRRAVRMSMGTVLQVPWAHVGGWRELGPQLHDAGYHVATLALDERSVTLDEFAEQVRSMPAHFDRLALVLGSEGYGVSDACLRTADTLVEIPMAHGIDSLNVAASSAVAMWALR
ncbi:RNA methyltransferase [Pseudoclavibacter sp. CFCC 14310]|uniref:TrmH family RNA methyltransferase n=1 Tax=Pseudoclavibacter sp. CFCC 14310 TaxID=2615180 RepID=UPI0013015122|nr:RNA methyltransferase [Pseudoclavibacter sp. CFCC 14310]KAB1647352.1 RNA methyltransferase [Pseudoclavibacter sp. CFCC 14310]